MSYSDFQAVLFRWQEEGEGDKGGAPVCCFPLLSSSFRKGVHLINTVRSGVRFHLGKEQEERERKSLKTTKDQNMTVLTLFFSKK